MQTLYHVARDGWNGTDLLSLYAQHKDDAYEMYAEQWAGCGELAFIHAHYVHCHAELADAQAFVADFGGEIVVVMVEEGEGEIEIEMDQDEYPHPMMRDRIPAAMCRRIS